jgi:hypothetical protein
LLSDLEMNHHRFLGIVAAVVERYCVPRWNTLLIDREGEDDEAEQRDADVIVFLAITGQGR